jgi:hypothetical protein
MQGKVRNAKVFFLREQYAFLTGPLCPAIDLAS